MSNKTKKRIKRKPKSSPGYMANYYKTWRDCDSFELMGNSKKKTTFYIRMPPCEHEWCLGEELRRKKIDPGFCNPRGLPWALGTLRYLPGYRRRCVKQQKNIARGKCNFPKFSPKEVLLSNHEKRVTSEFWKYLKPFFLYPSKPVYEDSLDICMCKCKTIEEQNSVYKDGDEGDGSSSGGSMGKSGATKANRSKQKKVSAKRSTPSRPLSQKNGSTTSKHSGMGRSSATKLSKPGTSEGKPLALNGDKPSTSVTMANIVVFDSSEPPEVAAGEPSTGAPLFLGESKPRSATKSLSPKKRVSKTQSPKSARDSKSLTENKSSNGPLSTTQMESLGVEQSPAATKSFLESEVVSKPQAAEDVLDTKESAEVTKTPGAPKPLTESSITQEAPLVFESPAAQQYTTTLPIILGAPEVYETPGTPEPLRDIKSPILLGPPEVYETPGIPETPRETKPPIILGPPKVYETPGITETPREIKPPVVQEAQDGKEILKTRGPPSGTELPFAPGAREDNKTPKALGLTTGQEVKEALKTPITPRGTEPPTAQGATEDNKYPKTPGLPGGTESPTAQGDNKTPKIPGLPRETEPSAAQGDNKTPKTPGLPRRPEPSDAQGAPEDNKTPKTLELPRGAELPAEPEAQEVKGAPRTPIHPRGTEPSATKGAPEDNKTPKTPELPGGTEPPAAKAVPEVDESPVESKPLKTQVFVEFSKDPTVTEGQATMRPTSSKTRKRLDFRSPRSARSVESAKRTPEESRTPKSENETPTRPGSA